MSIPLPPLNFSGGQQSARTGDQVTGTVGFGGFSYSNTDPVMMIGIAIAAAVGVYFVTRRQ